MTNPIIKLKNLPIDLDIIEHRLLITISYFRNWKWKHCWLIRGTYRENVYILFLCYYNSLWTVPKDVTNVRIIENISEKDDALCKYCNTKYYKIIRYIQTIQTYIYQWMVYKVDLSVIYRQVLIYITDMLLYIKLGWGFIFMTIGYISVSNQLLNYFHIYLTPSFNIC